MAYFLSPIGNDQQCDANGNPLVGGKIYTYLAGTTTAAATYTDSTSGTQQANPIVLNSMGLPASPIWMIGGQSMKFVIKDSADALIRTIDNVSGVNDTTNAASEWTETGLVPTYISTTQFSVVGDQTPTLQVNRRVRTRNTAGYIYSRITVSSYSAGLTTVTVLSDSGTLDSGLSLVAVGFLSFSPTSLPYGIYAGAGANTDITSVNSAVINSKIQPLTASVAGNALTVNLAATSLDFRSTTLGNGAPATMQNSAISLTVPSGATLGTVNATQSRIIVLAIDNAGAVELAVVNVAGGNDLSETGLISTTAISWSSNSSSTIYSSSARTSVAYRVVGFIDSTQATAGTWATAPSLVQGQGGQAMAALSSLGYGQTWQNVTASRALGTTYYNTTGRPIFVKVGSTGTTSASVTITVGGVTMPAWTVNTSASALANDSVIVPVSASYVITMTTGTLQSWVELR